MKPFFLTSFIFIFFANVQTQAQSACESAVTVQATQYSPEVFAKIRSMANTTKDFIEALVSRPETLDSKSVDAKILEVQKLTEDYFQAAGFIYEKNPAKVSVKNLKDTKNYDVIYNRYHISGTPWGDEASRMIYGMQVHSWYQLHPNTYVFDTMFLLNYPEMGAHFNAKSMQIVFGPHVIAEGALAFSNALRHESQHYIEKVKVREGKKTLARLVFKQPISFEKKIYSSSLHVDELETYLRDLRFFLDKTHLKKVDEELAKIYGDPQKIKSIQEIRAKNIATTTEIFQRILRDAAVTVKNLKLALEEGNSGNIIRRTNSIEVQFVIRGPYSKMEIDLSWIKGLDTDAQVFSELRDVVNWSESRIEQIQKEFDSLVGKTKTETP